MAIDYLSTMNKSGSGLNLSEVVTSLVEAEFTPKKDAVQKRIDDAETSISAVGRVRAQFEELKTAVTNLSGSSVYQAGTTSNSLSVEITDSAKVQETNTYLEVSQIAKRQVLEFTGFSSAEDVLGAGELTIEFGEWDSQPTPGFTPDAARETSITLEEGDTLTDLANKLNELEGVTARVIAKGDGTFSLGVNSEIGAENALRISEPVAGNYAAFDISSNVTDVQRQAATDAVFTLDGIEITRPTNKITDVIDGLTLTLYEPTDSPAEVVVLSDKQGAQNAVTNLVDSINALTDLLKTETSRGLDSETRGALAGDKVAQDLLRSMSSLTTQPIEGFGDRPVYLSELGVQTQRDGTLTVDTNQLGKVFDENPKLFDSIFKNAFSTQTDGVDVSGKAYDSTVAGTYDFTYDPNTGIGNLNGQSLTGTVGDDGRIYFVSVKGATRGISLAIDPDVTEAKVTFGRSLISSLEQQVSSVLSSSGDLARREDYFGDIVSEQSLELEDLDLKAESMESRYQQKFAAMEQIVTQLKGTGTYINNLIDSWQAMKNQ